MVSPPSPYLGTEWFAAIMLLVLILIAWVKVNYARRFHQLFTAVLNTRLLRQLMREELVFSHRASVVLTGVFLLVGASFLYLCDKLFHWAFFETGDFGLWWHYFALLFLIYFIKVLSFQLIRIIAEGDFGMEEYQYNVLLINKAAGLVLLPFTIVAAYLVSGAAQWVALGGGALFCLLFLFRWFRGISNALRNRVPLFYIILYFCTLEILPLALLYKVLVA